MEYKNKLSFKTFKQFYNWLNKNHDKTDQCWLVVNRGKPDKKCIWYIDAVYAALCFGWIDSIFKNIDGKTYQKFSPRNPKNNTWTELNKARCRWLIKNKLMTKSGLKILPDLNKKFIYDKYVVSALKKDIKVWNNFIKFPLLYQAIRIYNVAFYRKIDKKQYKKALANLIKYTKENKMYGSWNDNGRLG